MPIYKLEYIVLLTTLFMSSTASLAIPWKVKTASAMVTAAEDNNIVKYDIMDPQTPGICIEILRAIEKVDPSILFIGYEVPMSVARVELELSKGNLDAFCALLKTPERLKKFTFLETPLYTVHHKVAVRADDKIKVKNFDDIRKLGKEGVVLVPHGSGHEIYLNTQKGLIIDSSPSTDVVASLKMLIAKRGRFLYYSENVLRYYIKEYKLEKEIKILPSSFREENMYFILSRTVPLVDKTRLNDALIKLSKQGVLKNIYSKYR